MIILYFLIIFWIGFFINARLNESKVRDEYQRGLRDGYKKGLADALDMEDPKADYRDEGVGYLKE